MTESPKTYSTNQTDLPALISSRLAPRLPLLDPADPQLVRLLNGYAEGLPGWVVDLYAANLVISEHAAPDRTSHQTAEQIAHIIQSQLPWLEGILYKQRRSTDEEQRKGLWLMKTREAREVTENGVRYAIDLRLNPVSYTHLTLPTIYSV